MTHLCVPEGKGHSVAVLCVQSDSSLPSGVQATVNGKLVDELI